MIGRAWQTIRRIRRRRRFPEADRWAQIDHYHLDNLALLARGDPPEVVFLGDSITANWIALAPDFFRAGRINRGIGGQTTAQMLLRFRSDVVALRPRLVHIMAGTNDIARGGTPRAVDAARQNIASMAELAKASGIAVILAAVPPITSFQRSAVRHPVKWVGVLNGGLQAYAEAADLRFVDYAPALGDGCGGLDRTVALDGVHPNAAGYAAMAPIAERALVEARATLS